MLNWITASPLCRFFYKTQLDRCMFHDDDRALTERETFEWTRKGYTCSCKNPRYQFYQVCVSVLGRPVIRKPTDAVYMINVLIGTCREDHLEEAMQGNSGVTEHVTFTEFPLYDTLDESEEIQRNQVRVHLNNLLAGLRSVPKSYNTFEFQRFGNFQACTGQDKYINSFLELLTKLEKPPIPQEPKACAHVSRRLKQV